MGKAYMKRFLAGSTVFCMLAAATPAMATSISLPGTVQDYRAADGSRNYNEASVYGSLAVIGVSTGSGPGFLQYDGRFAGTIEFDISALPSNAVITNATLTLTSFFRDDSIATISSYVASSFAVDPARARSGSLITAFDVLDTPANLNIQFDVTNTLKTDLSKVAVDPIVGFSFEQVVDRCASTRDNGCISSLGRNDTTTLSISYDIPTTTPPSPPSAVPEPATWAMFISGLGLMGMMRLRRSGVA